MRILVLTNCPPFEYLGSGYVIKNFLDGLKKEFDVSFFDPRDYMIWNFLGNRAQDYRLWIGKWLFIRKKLKKEKFDMIEFWGADSWLAMKYCRKYFPEVMIIHHTNGPETKYEPVMRSLNESDYKWYHFDKNEFFDRSFSNAHGIITVSEDDAVWAAEKYPHVKVTAVNPGLTKDFLNLPVSLERAPVIGYAGTWLAKKGIDLIKNDMPGILRKFPDAKFKIIGVDKDFVLSDHFPEDVIARIEPISFIKEKQELIKVYQSLSIFILPSQVESFGLVMAEAMACGCALIVTKVGYAYSLIDNEEAILIEKNKKGDLYNGLSKLLSDDVLRKTMAAKGYDKVQQLTWDKSVEKLNRVYRKWYNEFLIERS